jgi:hypothetical protein
MRKYKWTIAALADQMNITQARVRQVRERGVTEGPHYVRDWIEALTRKVNPIMATKKPSAAQLRARKLFAERARSGAFVKSAGKRKPNPLTRVKANSPSMATGDAPSKRLVKRRKKTAKAPAGYYANPLTRVKRNSPSMATGKAPSKRLVKRRAKTAKAPAGYYANPVHAASKFKVYRADRDGKPTGAMLGSFPQKPAAIDYAQAVAKANRCSLVIVGGR